MERIWQLHEAKNKFSEVVAEAVTSGPQIITKHGVEAVVVLSMDEYRAMSAKRLPLSTFFRQSPLVGVELDLIRDQSELRDQDEL